MTQVTQNAAKVAEQNLDTATQASPRTMQLVLIRHGQSEWNKLNLFTG